MTSVRKGIKATAVLNQERLRGAAEASTAETCLLDMRRVGGGCEYGGDSSSTERRIRGQERGMERSESGVVWRRRGGRRE